MPVTAVISSVPAVMLFTGKVALLKLPLVLMRAWLVPALITAPVAAKVAALSEMLPVAAVLTVLSSVSVLAAVMLALPAVVVRLPMTCTLRPVSDTSRPLMVPRAARAPSVLFRPASRPSVSALLSARPVVAVPTVMLPPAPPAAPRLVLVDVPALPPAPARSTTLPLVLLRDPAYDALAITSLLYLGSMMAHARNSGTAAREAIELRFENIDLMTQATAAKLQAEQANLAKSKFLAAASHDLRQPIHAQGLFLEVLSHTPLSPHQADVLASARSASSASSDMLNTLLDFSRIEAGVVKPHNVPFDLQTLLNKIENDLAPQADAKGLVYRTRETNLTIDSDAALVEMILRNLVSNAIRYTEPVKGRGGVLVACRRRGTESTPMAVVQVWDTGIGIAPENCLDIFKEFHQLGNPERDRRKGLGLGLAIADGLAKTLGHRLGLASVPGRGSVFKLTLPMTQAPAVSTDMAAPQMTGQLQGAHVLVIDDDETVLTGMAQLLQSWGCRVDMASSISSALEHATRQAPQAIVSDYRLRGQQTGAQAIAAVRESLCLRIPALMVTGDTAPERLREALASGVPLLHKPMAPGQLYQALTGLLRG